MKPAPSASSSTVALAVSTTATCMPTCTSSPGRTSHSATTAVNSFAPSCGITMRPASTASESEHGVDEVAGVRQEPLLECLAARDRDVGGSHRRVRATAPLLGETGDQLAAPGPAARSLLECGHARATLHKARDVVHRHGRQKARNDHVARQLVFDQQLA